MLSFAAMTDLTPKQRATAPCVTCKEQIVLGATKCIHCDSFQDWRGTLSISSTVLSLSVALVAVLGFTLPIIRETTTPKNSDISLSIPFIKIAYHDLPPRKDAPRGYHNREGTAFVEVIAINSGVRAGFIETVDIHISFADEVQERLGQSTGGDDVRIYLDLPFDLEETMIPPGSAKVVKAKIVTDEGQWDDSKDTKRMFSDSYSPRLPQMQAVKAKQCEVETTILNFDGSQRWSYHDVTCSDVYFALAAATEKSNTDERFKDMK
jgi:hypothetical protein